MTSRSWLTVEPKSFDPFVSPEIGLATLGDPIDELGEDVPVAAPARAVTGPRQEEPSPAGSAEFDSGHTMAQSWEILLDDGRVIPVGGTVVIGRALAEAADVNATSVQVDDEMVSRRHLEISLQNGAVAVRDLGSTNGSSLVVGTQLQPFATGEAVIVGFGDRVHFGNRWFEMGLNAGES